MNLLRNLASFARMIMDEVPRVLQSQPAEVIELRQ